MGWTLVYRPAFDIEQAVAQAAKWEELQIALVMNERNLSQTEMEHDAVLLAKQLAFHPRKPWVVLGSRLNYLELAFRILKIRVEYGMVEDIIHERHVAEVEDDDKAATYTSTVGLEDSAPFPTFKEALMDFVKRTKILMEEGADSIRILETACWIGRNDTRNGPPLKFFSARYFGYKVGLMEIKSGKLEFNPNASEPDADILKELYIQCLLGNDRGFIRRMGTTRMSLAEASLLSTAG
jgi:hypothetical protein